MNIELRKGTIMKNIYDPSHPRHKEMMEKFRQERIAYEAEQSQAWFKGCEADRKAMYREGF